MRVFLFSVSDMEEGEGIPKFSEASVTTGISGVGSAVGTSLLSWVLRTSFTETPLFQKEFSLFSSYRQH